METKHWWFVWFVGVFLFCYVVVGGLFFFLRILWNAKSVYLGFFIHSDFFQIKLLLNKTFLAWSVDNDLIYIVWWLFLLPNTYLLKCFYLQVLLFTNLLLSSLVCLMACFKRILRKGKLSNPWQLLISSFSPLEKIVAMILYV